MFRSCILLPHGIYSLTVATLVTMGWIGALFEDGCNYAKLEGDIVADLALDPDTPYLEVGLQAYRIPTYNVNNELYQDEFFGKCIVYSSDIVEKDTAWKVSNGCSFIALVLGGGATFYLWISTCCKFSRGSWRWAGYEVLLAFIFQILSFIWFQSNICKENACTLFYGSKADIVASVLWFIAAIMIFGYYPTPKERDEDNNDGIMNDDDDNSQGSNDPDSHRNKRNEEEEVQQQQTESRPDNDVEMATGQDSVEQQHDNNGRKDLSDVQLT